LVKDLGIRSVQAWTKNEKSGLLAMAPVVAALRPGGWSPSEKSKVCKLLRAKGGNRELIYARLLAGSNKLLQELRTACLDAEKGNPF
jgi:hypothetical protein